MLEAPDGRCDEPEVSAVRARQSPNLILIFFDYGDGSLNSGLDGVFEVGLDLAAENFHFGSLRNFERDHAIREATDDADDAARGNDFVAAIERLEELELLFLLVPLRTDESEVEEREEGQENGKVQKQPLHRIGRSRQRAHLPERGQWWRQARGACSDRR